MIGSDHRELHEMFLPKLLAGIVTSTEVLSGESTENAHIMLEMAEKCSNYAKN